MNLVCVFLCFLPALLAYPQGSLVVSTEATSVKSENVQTTSVPKITEMKIETNVSNRFAKTLITSKVKNAAVTASEAVFSVVLPQQAFITGFIMEINDKNYTAYVQEKEQAKKTYDDAVQQGLSAAHVAVSARDSNVFTVNINLEPESKAVFYLTYEELLQRQKGQYEVVLNIRPGQLVKTIDVTVCINETRPLTFVRSPNLRSGNEITKTNDKLNPKSEVEFIDKNTATVKFTPDIVKQKEFAKELGTDENDGFAGQFVVQYDVERDPQGGEVLLDDGYFVHFFAPTNLTALPKYVIFVLDTSGSMTGIRIQQLKEAMRSILSELKPTDVFNVIEFNSEIKVWNVVNGKVSFKSGEVNYYWGPRTTTTEAPKENILPPAFEANPENVKKATEIVDNFRANGGTDIGNALETAVKLREHNKNVVNQPMIVFLTDGEPTVGEISTKAIISNITNLNSQQVPIFSLSFGEGADKAFLQEVSQKNLGFSRHIYEGADASLQLQDFYKQISSPLLSKVQFKYVSNVSELTQIEFPILFDGSEIVVAGRKSDGIEEPFVVECGQGKFVAKIEKPVTSLERLWAYLTVKEILKQRDIAEDKKELTKKALDIALKYSFVTDVTSLVVVKPNATNAVDTEDASKPGFPFLPVPQAIVPSAINRAPGLAGFGGGALYSAAVAPSLLFNGPPLLTTPYAPTLPPTTSLTSTTVSPIITNFPWISSLLTSDGKIEINNATYIIDPKEDIDQSQDCPLTPTNTTGTCTLLKLCPDVATIVTDLTKFLQYSCKLDLYTGICCPKPKP